MKIKFFCTGQDPQVHDISCPICDCDDMSTYSVMSWLPVSCISGRGPMIPLPPSLSVSIMTRRQINWMYPETLYTLSSVCIFSILFSTLYKVLTRRICLTIFGWWSFPLFLWLWCLIQGWHCKAQYSSEILGPKCTWKVHLKSAQGRATFQNTLKNMCKRSSLICTTVKRSSFAMWTHVAQDSTANSECTV